MALTQFITKPSSININSINSKFYSLMPSEHRSVFIENRSIEPLLSYCEYENVGEQIDVSEYLAFKSGYYLGTISCMENLLFDESEGENISPEIYKASSRKLSKGEFIISRNASLGKIAYLNEDKSIILNGGISYFKFKSKYNFYVPAFFITNYGTDYLACITSGGGTQQNAKRSVLLSVPIPKPTLKNNIEPENIVTYVSLLVQNIIHKEEQIKRKEKLINELINNELALNSGGQKFDYEQPKISEIFSNQNRLDTGLYNPKFKKTINDIKAYSNGYFKIKSLSHKWVSGSTPNVFLEKSDGDYWWIAVADISYGLLFKEIKRFKLYEDVNNLLADGDILITRKGATVGKLNLYFKENNLKAFVNEDLKVLRLNVELYKKIFVGLFLNNNHGQIQLLNKGSKGTKQGLTNPNITDSIIPNFSEEKQREIAKVYHNPQPLNTELDLTNYLAKEELRNESIGIFQLNMEILTLRKKLTDVIDKIIKEEQIIVCF